MEQPLSATPSKKPPRRPRNDPAQPASRRANTPAVTHQQHPKHVNHSESETASPLHSTQASRASSPRRRKASNAAAKTPNKNTANTPRRARSASHARHASSTSDKEFDASSSVPVHPESDYNSQKNKNNTRNHRKNQSASQVHHSAASHAHTISYMDGTASAPPMDAATTPAKQMAYAGPTFHASPAASSLPIPKLFAKHTSNSTATAPIPSSLPNMQNRLEQGMEEPGPKGVDVVGGHDGPVPPREESPLDFFFNAQRAEKARQSSYAATPPQTNQGFTTPNSSSTSSVSARTHSLGTPASAYHQSSFSPHSASKQALMMELDGVSDDHSDDLHSVPASFKDRMETMRGASPQAYAGEGELQRKAKTLALKNLLMHQQDLSPQRPEYRSVSIPTSSGITPPKGAPVQQHFQRPQPFSPYSDANIKNRPDTVNGGANSILSSLPPPPQQPNEQKSPSPQQQNPSISHGVSTTPSPLHYHTWSAGQTPPNIKSSGANESKEQLNGSTDLKNMENNLRRILKLDS